MDDVVNRFARELADAIAAAVAENPEVEACRERARAAGYEMKVTLEAVVGFVTRAQGEGKTKARRCRRKSRPPRRRWSPRQLVEMTANDRRFLRSLRIAADDAKVEETELITQGATHGVAPALWPHPTVSRCTPESRPPPPPSSPPPDRPGSGFPAISGLHPARRPAECPSGCSARRCPGPRCRRGTSRARAASCRARRSARACPRWMAGAIVVVPVRQEARDRVLERLGERQLARAAAPRSADRAPGWRGSSGVSGGGGMS